MYGDEQQYRNSRRKWKRCVFTDGRDNSMTLYRSHCCLGAPVRRDACHTSALLPLGGEALAAAELEEAATTASDKDHHTSRPLLLALGHFSCLNLCINQLQAFSRRCCHCAEFHLSSSPAGFPPP